MYRGWVCEQGYCSSCSNQYRFFTRLCYVTMIRQFCNLHAILHDDCGVEKLPQYLSNQTCTSCRGAKKKKHLLMEHATTKYASGHITLLKKKQELLLAIFLDLDLCCCKYLSSHKVFQSRWYTLSQKYEYQVIWMNMKQRTAVV